MKKHIRKLQRQGSSLVIPIPKQIREDAHLIEGMKFSIEEKGGVLIIQKITEWKYCTKCDGDGIIIKRDKK